MLVNSDFLWAVEQVKYYYESDFVSPSKKIPEKQI